MTRNDNVRGRNADGTTENQSQMIQSAIYAYQKKNPSAYGDADKWNVYFAIVERAKTEMERSGRDSVSRTDVLRAIESHFALIARMRRDAEWIAQDAIANPIPSVASPDAPSTSENAPSAPIVISGWNVADTQDADAINDRWTRAHARRDAMLADARARETDADYLPMD